MASRSAAASSVNWQEIITACLPRLALFDVARTSVSSKAASQLLRQQLVCGQREVARTLLHGAVQAASACSHKPAVLQHTESVRWLLNIAHIPAKLVLEDSLHFISVSNVPLDICKQLVNAGVRVTNEQLLSAVRNHVDRPHNWVLAHRSLELPTGLPQMAEAVCCSDFAALTDDALKDVSSAELHDLLSLAIATIGCGTTSAQHSAVERTVGALVDAPHVLATKELNQSDFESVHLFRRTRLAQLLQLAVDTLSRRAAQTDLDALYGVDAFSRMKPFWLAVVYSSNDAYQLMKAAITQRLHRTYLRFLLQSLQMTKHLTTDMVAELLEIQLHNVAGDPNSILMVVRHLCRRHPAITADRCMDIFHTAVEVLLPYPMPGLCSSVIASLASLSGLQQASTYQVLSELNHVLDVSTQHQVPAGQAAKAVAVLCSLTRAKTIVAKDLDKLITQAEKLWGEDAPILAYLVKLLGNRPSSPANSTEAVIV